MKKSPVYLPDELPNAEVLITVKTYPLPSNKYGELVCTAGVLADGRWIRIYPISYRNLPTEQQYRKYEWIRLNLVRNTSDFRPESYRPQLGFDEPIVSLGWLDTENGWEKRKPYILGNVYTSMDELIHLAKGPECRSLATLKPKEIVDFVIEPDTREWKQQWRDQLEQYDLFDLDEQGAGQVRKIVDKVPYKYSYQFLSEGDTKPRQMMIEDWEIGALYWNCLRNAGWDEVEANRKVRQMYFDTFVSKNDPYLFLGTTKKFHKVGPNPFVIIGIFYPPKPPTSAQLTLEW